MCYYVDVHVRIMARNNSIVLVYSVCAFTLLYFIAILALVEHCVSWLMYMSVMCQNMCFIAIYGQCSRARNNITHMTNYERIRKKQCLFLQKVLTLHFYCVNIVLLIRCTSTHKCRVSNQMTILWAGCGIVLGGARSGYYNQRYC